MQLPRASGILLHPTSLPGRHGIGDLGPEAHAFVDWLAETGQTWWQILPLGPVGYGGSPYQSPSSFAGNPLLISLDRLADRGWLDARELAAVPDRPADRVDFDAVAELKWEWLRRAFRGFAAAGEDPAFEAFRAAASLAGWTTTCSSRPSATPTTASRGTSGSRSWSPASRRPVPDGASSSPRASASTSSSSTPSRPSGRTCARPARRKGSS